jgi:hypothetical protein
MAASVRADVERRGNAHARMLALRFGFVHDGRVHLGGHR